MSMKKAALKHPKKELDYLTRRAWRAWFTGIDREMESNIAVWLRVFVKREFPTK